MAGEPEDGSASKGERSESFEIEHFRVKLIDILSGREAPPVPKPEDTPDPIAFGFLFGFEAGLFPGAATIVKGILREPTKGDRGPILHKLENLENRRSQAWHSGIGWSRPQAAAGLVAVLTVGGLEAEIESKDHERIARDVIRGWAELRKIKEWAQSHGDSESLNHCGVLGRALDSYFPEEERLRRRAGRRDKKSRNGAGLRERLLALRLHEYFTMALGPRDSTGRNDRWRSGLIADLLWEMTGLEIDAKQVSRWISSYEKSL